MTPLANAAYDGKVDCIRALVELGAELEAKDGVRVATRCQAWRCVMLLTLAGALRVAARNDTARKRC